MKVDVQAVKLSNPSGENSVVKTVALFSFRALRTVADYACALPALATEAVADVAEAWVESRPDSKS